MRKALLIKLNIRKFSLVVSKLKGSNNDICALYLNSPKNKNALSRLLIEDLKGEIDKINVNTNIRSAFIMSNEPGYFCTGADLKERVGMSENDVKCFVTKLRDTFQDIAELRVPVISAIDGYALGGGLELALATDFRILSKSAQIGLTETALGIIPGAGGTQRLSRLIGLSKAKEMIFTAERINTQEALKLGIANFEAENYEELEEKCISFLEKINKNAPLGILYAKMAIDQGFGCSIKNGLEIEKIFYSKIVKTEDRLEGLNAFSQKRKPIYKGK